MKAQLPRGKTTIPFQFCNAVKGGYSVFRKSKRPMQTEEKTSNSASWNFTVTLPFKKNFSGEQSITFLVF